MAPTLASMVLLLQCANALLDRRRIFESWVEWVSFGGPNNSTSVATVMKGNELHQLPVFSLIGAQKSGTTYLKWLLNQHPELESGYGINGRPRDECHFFDAGYEESLTKASIAEAYATLFRSPTNVSGAPASLTELDITAKKLQNIIWFDDTPRYLVNTEVPERMRVLIPTMKLIVLLRDPTERYESQMKVSWTFAYIMNATNNFVFR